MGMTVKSDPRGLRHRIQNQRLLFSNQVSAKERFCHTISYFCYCYLKCIFIQCKIQIQLALSTYVKYFTKDGRYSVHGFLYLNQTLVRLPDTKINILMRYAVVRFVNALHRSFMHYHLAQDIKSKMLSLFSI